MKSSCIPPPPPARKKKFVLPVNQVVCGDNLTVVSDWPDNCIDGVVTDPPYGLEFMGKEWDKLQTHPERAWRRRIKENSDDSEKDWGVFNRTSKCAPHLYKTEGMQQWHYQWAKAMLRICKPGAILLCFGGTRTYHRLTCAIEDAGWEIRDCMMWLYGSGFPKSLNIALKFEQQLCERRNNKWYYVSTSEEIRKEPPFKHPLANKYFGYGTALKPAWEPIIVAMKPLDGTFAANAEKWKVAGLNIDGGRIGTEQMGGGTMPDLRDVGRMSKEAIGIDKLSFGQTSGAKRKEHPKYTGRWPANLILDEEAGKMLDEQSGDRPSGGGIKAPKKNNPYGSKRTWNVSKTKGEGQAGIGGDSGGASRFFMRFKYCAKTSRKERNLGLNKYHIELEICLCEENIEQATLLEKVISESVMEVGNQECNTILCGKNTMEQPLKIIVSTTLTETNKTTELKTWNVLILQPINEFIVGVIKIIREHGLNLVVNVGSINQLQNIMKDKVVLVPGVKVAVSEMPLKISVNIKQQVNSHPTIKPLALMKYLCTLLKMPNQDQIILDPFMGSGTTGMACKELGINYIGIEKEKEYCEIAEKRIAAV